MKIGLDIHGVIDKFPEYFSNLSWSLKKKGHEIYVITGQEYIKVFPKIDKFHIGCDKVFSIVDYHKSLGTRMWQDDKGTWWMDGHEWIRTKGDFCEREKIDIHFDDSIEYAEFMPSFTTFILVPKTGFELVIEHFLHF